MTHPRPFALVLPLTLAIGAAIGPSARADDAAPGRSAPGSTEVASRATEAGTESGARGVALSGDVVAQTLNTYLYRGFLTEDRGLIVQAWTDVHATIPIGGVLESVDVHGQFWNSMTTGLTGTGGPNESPRLWSEADLLLGVAFATAGGFSLDVTYTWLRAPNGSFEDLDELGFTLAYDDSARWKDGPGPFRGWNPSVTVAIETLGREDLSGSSGTYLGFGVKPTFAAWRADDAPTFALPVTVGTSLSNYYEDADGHDHFLGFVDVGCDVEVPVGGSLSVNFSAHAVVLGETPREYGGNRDVRCVLTIGLAFTF